MRMTKSKDQELQELYKSNTELSTRDEKLTVENHDLKQVLEKVSKFVTIKFQFITLLYRSC